MTNFQEYKMPGRIDGGAEAEVYRISERHVAKVPLDHRSSPDRDLTHEFEIAEDLFENGISVPKPEGIFPIHLMNSVRNGFVMEFIDGKSGARLRGNEISYVRDLLYKEIRKVRDLGFDPEDWYSPKNYIWEPQEDKIYLIDFLRWVKK